MEMPVYNKWRVKNPGREYNDMIKAAVDVDLLDTSKQEAEIALAAVGE